MIDKYEIIRARAVDRHRMVVFFEILDVKSAIAKIDYRGNKLIRFH